MKVCEVRWPGHADWRQGCAPRERPISERPAVVSRVAHLLRQQQGGLRSISAPGATAGMPLWAQTSTKPTRYWPDCGRPIVVVFDELPYFSATFGDRKQQNEFTTAVQDLVTRGRAAGLIVVVATQRPSADIIRRACGICSGTGGRSGAPLRPPSTSSSATAGSARATAPATSIPAPAASAGCWPRVAFRVGFGRHTSRTLRCASWRRWQLGAARPSRRCRERRRGPGGRAIETGPGRRSDEWRSGGATRR
jgi:hypothetical protein